MNPTTNKSAIRSQMEITQALMNLIKEKPYAEITVKEILIDSKISRKTFYRNFESKDDVLKAYILRIMCEYSDEVLKKKYITLPDIVDIAFPFCESKKELFLLLSKNNLLNMILDALNVNIPKLHYAITGLDISSDTAYMLAFNIGAFYNVLQKWIEGGMQDSAEEIKITLKRYLSSMQIIE